jgi:hypothetical protein
MYQFALCYILKMHSLRTLTAEINLRAVATLLGIEIIDFRITESNR